MLHSRIIRIQSVNNLLIREARRSLDNSKTDEEMCKIRDEIEQRNRIETELRKIIKRLERRISIPQRMVARSLASLTETMSSIYKQIPATDNSKLERKNVRLYYNLLYNHRLSHSVTKKLLQQKNFLENRLSEYS